jgi:hypothetical protein
VIGLWLGHESIKTTHIYLHAHLSLKEAALAKVKPFNGQKIGSYKPGDRLLAFLDDLWHDAGLLAQHIEPVARHRLDPSRRSLTALVTARRSSAHKSSSNEPPRTRASQARSVAGQAWSRAASCRRGVTPCPRPRTARTSDYGSEHVVGTHKQEAGVCRFRAA